MNLKKIVVYQEEISDCGVSCLLSIIRYYNGDANLETLRMETNTTNKGVTAYDLIECAKKNGFNASGYKDFDISKYKLPCILHIKINQSLSHFVVLYEIRKSTFVIMDPAKGLIKVNKELYKENITGNIIVLEPRQSSLPKKKNKNIIKREIITELKKHHHNILKIILLEILFIILSIISSFYIKIYNYKEYIAILSIIFAFVSICIEVISYLVFNKTINLENHISSDLSDYFFNHILNLPLKYLHLKDPGEIVKRANEVEAINQVIINSLLSITINILIVLSVLPFLIIMENKVLFIIIILVLMIVMLSSLTIKKLRIKSKEAIEASTEYNNILIDGIYGLTSIKHAKGEEYLKERTKNNLKDKLIKERDYSLYLKKYETIKSSILTCARVLINIYLISKIYSNTFSFESLIIIDAFIEIILNSSSNIISSFMELVFVKNLFIKANDFYNIEYKEISNKKKFINGDIEFKNINYTYHSNYPIIKNFTTTIKRGEKVIIKGESGRGKSTLCKILYQEIEDYKGNILISGKNIKEICTCEYRKNVTYSSQTERIINGSIKENILLGKQIPEERLSKIIELCKIERITKKRTFGINTILFSGGEELSGGERQLIFLARALANDFNILILDETLSEVNDEVEDQILENLFNYYKNKTIIYVTHKNNKRYFKRIINV